MRKRILWLVVIFVLPLSTAWASNGSMAKIKLQKKDGSWVEKSSEKPKYGGTFYQMRTTSPQYFDTAFGLCYLAHTLFQTNEQLLQGDWTKGPQGTGEVSWKYFMVPSPDTMTGSLAESWELVDDTTMRFHIRKGVHFHDKPPTNGREMDANDVVYTLKRLWESPKSYHYKVFPWETHMEAITAPDKWTVVIKTKPGWLGTIWECATTYGKIVPHEVVEKYGDINDWRNACGTGPFMLMDYVADSSITFVRNPNYWMRDPLHPQNQLPYINELKYFIIPDVSTQLAALRTGKVDLHFGVNWEDAKSLRETSPQLIWEKYAPTSSLALFGRIDTKPFDDVRVRRALAMAINNQELVDTFYGGNAEIFHNQIMPVPEFGDIYVPLDKMPQSVRELYEYHPEKAKRLLAEAGYPNGFKTEVMCYSSYVDVLSIIKNYWLTIGIELELVVKEYGAYISLGKSRGYNQIYCAGLNSSIPFRFVMYGPGNFQNYSLVDDPVINETAEKIKAGYFDPRKRQWMKEIHPYLQEQAYYIPLPGEYTYACWQPWVKNCQGELHVGYMGNYFDPHKYFWVDTELREKSLGKK